MITLRRFSCASVSPAFMIALWLAVGSAIGWTADRDAAATASAASPVLVDYEQIRARWENQLEAARAAAEKGDVTAQHYLGRLAFDAPPETRDYEVAYRWFARAAAKGFANSETMMGTLYLRGWGIEQDDQTAVEWYQKAAAHGSPVAYLNLGLLTLRGKGIAKNETAGLDWLFKADAVQRGLAEDRLREIFKLKKSTGSLPELMDIYRHGADLGSATARFELAEACARGEASPRDERDHPQRLYELAAAQGFPDAYMVLAGRYLTGYMVSRDFVKAAYWTHRHFKAIEASSTATATASATFSRGRDGRFQPVSGKSMDPVYQTGENRDRAISREEILWTETARTYSNFIYQRDAAAATALGNLYVAGRGVPVDLVEACAWYQIAIALGDPSATALAAGLKDKLSPADLAKVSERSRWLKN